MDEDDLANDPSDATGATVLDVPTGGGMGDFSACNALFSRSSASILLRSAAVSSVAVSAVLAILACSKVGWSYCCASENVESRSLHYLARHDG